MKTNHNIEEQEAMLRRRFGAEMHFAVPEGYFDALPGKVMSRIDRRNRRRMLFRWAVAAVLAGCVFAGGMFTWKEEQVKLADKADVQYIEDALDYSMIDNMSIASYLTEAE